MFIRLDIRHNTTMSSLVKKRCIDYEEELSFSLVDRKRCGENTSTETIVIPSTPISKLKASFPSIEDQILERALMYCNMDVRNASVLLQNQLFLSYNQQVEEKKLEIPTEKCRRRTDLVRLYLDCVGKALTYEEVKKLTQNLLKRYKGTLELGEASVENDRKKNAILKKGMRILTQRYTNLCQILQDEQRKVSDKEKRLMQMANEINYYKAMASSLSNKIEELNYSSADKK
eukprot:TRINITY_DN7328_c0_g4_i1.p1 TRINITY_DN7328_c0_g4~~TRINITY_DN7328_c0_g4_i1.p1  ORF type:complete len:231 (+),score=61.27 TRINITY_DN7328_c0_g4_i1:54-746(+)